MTDEQLLMALHLRDAEGMYANDIGERFGRTKNSIVGAMHRIDTDLRNSDPDGNQNGSMPIMWWRR